MTKLLSKCCKAKIRADCEDEGTCCYTCKKCGKPCDFLEKPMTTKKPEQWEKDFDYNFKHTDKNEVGYVPVFKTERIKDFICFLLKKERQRVLEKTDKVLRGWFFPQKRNVIGVKIKQSDKESNLEDVEKTIKKIIEEVEQKII
jgi:hypothetical protein